MKKPALALIAATLLSPVALTTPASAQDDAVVLRIDSSGLDLSSAKDQQRLQTRVRSAVRSACRADSHSLRDLTAAAECEAATMDVAQDKMELAFAKPRAGTERQNLR